MRYVRATRTSLLRTARTGGAGQLAPARHVLYVQARAYTYRPRACGTHRVPWSSPQAEAAAKRDATLEALGEELNACLRGGEAGAKAGAGGARRGEQPRGQPPEGELVRVRPRNLWPCSK